MTTDKVNAKIIDNLYADRPIRLFDICPTLRAGREGLLVLIMPKQNDNDKDEQNGI